MTITIRLVFALLGALGAVRIVTQTTLTDSHHPAFSRYLVWAAVALGGALAGWLVGMLAGSAFARAIRRVEAQATSRSASELVVGGVGLLAGLGAAALLGLAVSSLPYVGGYALLPLYLVLGYVFAVVAARKARSILRLVGINPARLDSSGERREPATAAKLIDTSAIIDGRLGDIIGTGFVDGELVIPVFVLEELQRVADSTDAQRRARGRRGLDVVHDLRRSRQIATPDIDFPDLADVDAKLVRLAKERSMTIVTTDYNLNKLARIQSVDVLNVNDLANALKPALLPGERIQLKVLRAGKEAAQGVGYLDDGTMVVVEGGASHVGAAVPVEVTSILQSPSGKIIFTRILAA